MLVVLVVVLVIVVVLVLNVIVTVNVCGSDDSGAGSCVSDSCSAIDKCESSSKHVW